MQDFQHKVLVTLLCISVPIIGFFLYTKFPISTLLHPPQDSYVITFNDKTPLRVEVLDDRAELIRGLSGRTSLPPTEGVLFVFPVDDFQGIWMKEMLFPIDIIWIDSEGIITDIAENVQPDTYPKVFEPTRKARYVIEANAYFASSFGIQAGDSVRLPKTIPGTALQY